MSNHDTVRELVRDHGTTYAERAGITLRDKPSPLFQLLVLTQLASVPISAGIAADAAREVFRAGWRTPERLRDATWQQRVDALGRAHYKRYDESTSAKLEELADAVLGTCRGDLRRLRPDSHGGVGTLHEAIEGFPRIGPTGAGIFCREVQAVWPEARPYFDDRAARRRRPGAAHRSRPAREPGAAARRRTAGCGARRSGQLLAVS
ncbi:MAG: endonuclease [Nocardioidaceae bacterium]|nr:endonuclease [Nocardioidaceae bacterium]MCL2614219.1 endonuclease [Nocardioidaceae bacterium]